MRRTLNEVYRICQKACEGAGAPDGLDIEAARGCVWLMARGFLVLTALLRDLARAAETPAACCFDEAQITAGTLDASHKAGALIAPALVDLAVAQASDHSEPGRLVVTDLSAPLLLLPAAAHHAGEGWQFVFSLKNTHGDRFVLRARPTGVDVLGSAEANLSTLFDSASFDLEATCAGTECESPENDPRLDVLASSDTLARSEARARANGVDVATDLWTRLSELATAVLVPASDASRQRGAGAGLQDNE